jgi:GDP-4-dehydro-6-deoxy-D-mannose reductase
VLVLITGSKGFVGKWLTDELIQNDFDVIGVDHDADITNKDLLYKKLSEIKPDIIYHLAAASHVGVSWSDPIEVVKVNALGTYQLINLAVEVNPLVKIIVVSSGEVYGKVEPSRLPIKETEPINPYTPYGASKAAAEIFATQLYNSKKANVIIVRPFNHVGPGQSDRFVVSALAKRLVVARKNGFKEITVGNIDSKRDYLDVRDAVSAYRLIGGLDAYGEVFNLCSGRSYSVREIIEMMQKEYDYTVELRPDPELIRNVDIPELRGSYEKLESFTKWQPTISIERTIKDTLAYWESATLSSKK